MNIMLTDISSLTLEQQEVPVGVESGADSFSGMFSQQLPQTSVKEGQGVDLKGFFGKLPLQAETTGIIPELPTVTTDVVFPLPDPGKLLSDSSPVTNIPPEAVDELVNLIPGPDSNGMLNAPKSGETGELLPVGGNLLPADAGHEITKQGMFEKAVAPSVAVAAVTEATRSASLPQATQAPVVAAQANKLLSLQGSTIGVAEKGFAATDFIAVMAKSSGSEAEQVIAGDKIVTPETAQSINKELSPKARLFAATAGVTKMSRPDVGTVKPPSRPVELAGLTLQPVIRAVAPLVTDQSALAEPVRKGLIQKVRMDVAPTPVSITEKVQLSEQRILPVADSLTVRDTLNTPDYRNLDIPTPPAANTSPQNAALSTSAAQAFSALSSPPAATAQTNVLPTHLETLTLARNADSTELAGGLSERVNWMINQKQNTATMRLDPPYLGKLDVQIKVADDATTIVFQTQHAQTRDLIESASVRLRDFLQESGYQNVNVDVSQRQDQQQARAHTNLDPDAEQQDESYQDPDFSQQERDAASYFIGEGIVDTFA